MKEQEFALSFSFQQPWTRVGEHAGNLEAELRKEVSAGHPLYSLSVRAIAQRLDTDEVLFEVDSPAFRYAVAHLSWTGQPEIDPRWPTTELFASFEDWIKAGIRFHE